MKKKKKTGGKRGVKKSDSCSNQSDATFFSRVDVENKLKATLQTNVYIHS